MSIRRLQWVAAVAAALSAIFWMLSAAVTFPAMGIYWNAMPADAPWQKAFVAAARWNSFAAFFAAIAAGVQAIAFGLSTRRRR
jgi:hypothetical protein